MSTELPNSLLSFTVNYQFSNINFIFRVCRSLKTTSKPIETPRNQLGFQFKKFDCATAVQHYLAFSVVYTKNYFQAFKLR